MVVRNSTWSILALMVGIVIPLEAQSASPGAAPPPAELGRAMGVSQEAPLDRRVALDLRDVTLETALEEISRQADLGLTFTPRVVPLEKRVTVRGRLSVRQALERVLQDTEAEAVVTSSGTVMVVRRRAPTSSREDAAVGIVFGVVTDSATAQPVENVLVSVQGTELRTTTNERGQYQLRDVPSGVQVIMTRLLGYLPLEKEVTVVDDRRHRVDFALKHGLTRLQEVVTTATGPRRRLELGNDITVINADSIVRTQPVTSVTDLLEGRVPGLTVQRTSGAPGDPARLRLRGASSPNLNNDPIVIVDGVRVYAEQSTERGGNLAGVSGTFSEYAAPSPLDYIDPNSIETIEVIKGPSAATLYGQDAANGVIVITSKKGQEGPARWTVSAERGMSEMVGSYPELMVRWGHPVADDARIHCPISNRGFQIVVATTCQGDSTSRYQMLNDPDLTVLDRGHRTGATVGVSGGSAALTYNVTGSFRDEVGLVRLPTYEADRYRAEQGTAVPDWMRRPQSLSQWGAASRITARISPKADVSLSANLSRTTQQRSELEQQLGRLMSTFLDRSSGIYYVGTSTGRLDELGQTLVDYHERATAVATKFTNGASLNWRPVSWLTTTADAGIDVVQRTDEILLPHGFGTGSEVVGRLRMAQGTSVMSTVNVRALATAPLPRGFRLQLATGVNYTGQSVEDMFGNALGLPEGTESPNDLQQADDDFRRRSVEQATFGWYIEPQLNHRRFWLSSGIRLDGGNTFGTRATLPAFPKLSLSYLVSDEGFFPWKKFVPVLRLRAAYGQAGRQPGPTDRLRLYGAAAPVLVDGEMVDGVLLEEIGNSRLEPERSTEVEGGFDADLFDDRLTVSVTGYRKTTTDALLSVPLAPSVYGAGVSTFKNIGTIRNTGFEGTVGARVIRTDAITWDVHASLSQQRNIVVELGPGVEPFWASGGSDNLGGTRVVAGYPLFGRWVKPMLGYADANGNGIIDRTEVLIGDTAVFVGGTLPNYTANFSTTLTFLRGALSVSAGVLYEDGMTQNNDVGKALAPFTAGWNDPNSSFAEQARMWDASGYSWVQTVSTLRFNSLAVTYNVPAYLAQRVGARGLSLSLQGTNLGIRTNYWGIDPNVNAHSIGNGVNDTGVLPRPRTWQVRLNAAY